mgnify:CR=1 FL=1
MIHVHIADRGTTAFSGDFSQAYEAAQAYIQKPARDGNPCGPDSSTV